MARFKQEFSEHSEVNLADQALRVIDYVLSLTMMGAALLLVQYGV